MKRLGICVLAVGVLGTGMAWGDQTITNNLVVASNLTVNLAAQINGATSLRGGITASTNLIVRGTNADWLVLSTNGAAFLVPVRLGGTNTLPRSPSGVTIAATLQRDPYTTNSTWSSTLGFEYYSWQAGRLMTNYLCAWEGLGSTAPGLYREVSTNEWDRIWDAGSDGAGSCLDADLLDGHEGTYFVSTSGGTVSNLTVSGILTVGGTGLSVTGDCVRLGVAAVVGLYSEVMGWGATATRYSATMGTLALARTNSVAMGMYAIADDHSEAVGYDTKAFYNSAALGPRAEARNDSAAIGDESLATDFSVALGLWAVADSYGTALGYGTGASDHGTVVGESASADGSGVAVGSSAYGASSGVAMGLWADGREEGTALGAFSYGRTNGVAIGYYARAGGPGQFAIGGATSAGTQQSVAAGDGAGQLGPGTNATVNSLQFRGWPLVLDGGNVPVARITNAMAQGIAYIPAQGNLSMGCFTNRP